MLARIRQAKDKDQGFTLIELLVVIIIIGILSAIAIPVFMNQSRKAVDQAAQADVSAIAKQAATYFIDNDEALSIDNAGGTYTITGGTAAEPFSQTVAKSDDAFTAEITAVDTAADMDATNYKVRITYDGGTKAWVEYDANAGIVVPTP